MSKKILCVVLCLLMCLSLLPVGALAAEESPEEEPLIEEIPVGEILEEVPEEENPEEIIPEETPVEEVLEEELPEKLPEEETPESDYLTEETEDAELPEIKYLVYKDGDFAEAGTTDYILVDAEEWGKLEQFSDVPMKPGCYVFSGRVETKARIVFTGKTSIILMNDCDVQIVCGIGL